MASISHVSESKYGKAYTEPTWRYLSEKGIRNDTVKDSLEADTLKNFEDDFIMVSQRYQCELFEFILTFANAKNCIEIGVFTGSSALSIARGLSEGGKLYALDVSQEFTDLAKKYWELDGVADKIELILGPATDTLNRFIEEGKEGTFDFIYIDADKPSYSQYYEQAIRLLRKGGLIMLDNVLWFNRIADPNFQDQNTLGLRNVNEVVYNDPRVKHTILPIGDGVHVIIKR